MHWAQTIPGISPADRRRAESIQERKARLNAEAAELKDRILSEISKLVDEEVELYRDIARKKNWTDGLNPTAIAAMEYPTLCRLLEGTTGHSAKKDVDGDHHAVRKKSASH